MGAKKKWEKEDEEAKKYGQQPIFSNFTEERAKAEVMKQEIMDSLKAEFEAKMAAMEERWASQTVKEMVPLASPGARRSSCTSAPYEASPIDKLPGPAQCKMQIKFTTMNFSMDAAFGQVWPSPRGN